MPFDPRVDPPEAIAEDPTHLREVRDAVEEYARRAAAASERSADHALAASQGVSVLTNVLRETSERHGSAIGQVRADIHEMRGHFAMRMTAIEGGLARLSANVREPAPGAGVQSSGRARVSGGVRFRVPLDNPGRLHALGIFVKTVLPTLVAAGVTIAYLLEHIKGAHP